MIKRKKTTVAFEQDKRGKWRGKTTAENGNALVATTQGYVDKRDARKAMIRSAIAILRQCGFGGY